MPVHHIRTHTIKEKPYKISNNTFSLFLFIRKKNTQTDEWPA